VFARFRYNDLKSRNRKLEIWGRRRWWSFALDGAESHSRALGSMKIRAIGSRKIPQ
jgi:hypothetical protein